jgi:hypothetical protein
MTTERIIATQEGPEAQQTVEFGDFDPERFQSWLPSWEVRVLNDGQRYHVVHESDDKRGGSVQNSIEVYIPGEVISEERRNMDRVWVFTDGSIEPFLNVERFSFESSEDGTPVVRFQNGGGDLVVFDSGEIVFEPKQAESE